ncbi:MAG: transporter associated domain-containing protein, partial [Gemmatimonadota bacterium]
DPHWVEPEFPALRLLHVFQASGVHMAIVRDAARRVQGIVTVTDLLERVVGDLPDVRELGDRAIVRRKDGSWLIDASIPITELHHALPEPQRRSLSGVTDDTVADLITDRLEGEIGPADAIELDGLRFEVVDMDGARIDKVLVSYTIES